MKQKPTSWIVPVVALLVACCATAWTAPEDTAPHRLYVIGDSISMHYGPYLEQYLGGAMSYARKTAEEETALGMTGAPTANGGDSSKVLEFLEAKERAGGLKADLLLLNCGLHDIKTNPDTGEKQVPLAAYQKNLEAIVACAQRMKIAVVWVRTTPCDEAVHNTPGKGFHRFAADVIAYNAAADAIMEAHGIPEIDLHGFTLRLGDSLYADHVHFPPAIREKQAAYIAGFLARWRQSGQTPE